MPKYDYEKDEIYREANPVPEKKKHRPMVCPFCKATDIWTEYNIGYDIDIEGEYNQHLDNCSNCGAERMWAEGVSFETGLPETQIGSWTQA